MFRKGEISTETDKKPFIFTLAALAGCLVSGILILVFAKGDALGIFASVLLFIVAASAAAVLFAMVTDRAYIEDGTLHMSYMFKRVRMPLTGIGKVTRKARWQAPSMESSPGSTRSSSRWTGQGSFSSEYIGCPESVFGDIIII